MGPIRLADVSATGFRGYPAGHHGLSRATGLIRLDAIGTRTWASKTARLSNGLATLAPVLVSTTFSNFLIELP
jgi:hypothetical protein